MRDTQLSDIERQLKGSSVAPNSAEERELLAQARAIKAHETDEFRTVRQEALSAHANPMDVVQPAASRHAAQVALEHVTGEHQIVAAAIPPAPAQHEALRQ